MPISIIDHSAKIASKIVGKFEELIPVRSGFSGWFPEETAPTLYVDVEVQRDNDLIAVDVVRFTEGNKNKYSRVTENVYQPPYFKEDYDFQRDQIYMNNIALGVGMENAQVNKIITMNAFKNVEKNRNKIIRAIRKQQADVLQTGIVSLVNGDNIDYKRKATSMVNVSTGPGGVYWDNIASRPDLDIRYGLDFLRNVGNSGGSSVNVIMRSKAFENMMNTTYMKDQGKNILQQINRVNISMPQFDGASGFAHQGVLASGDFSVHLWTYNEKYTDANGATKYYLAENLVVMMPDDFQGKTVFGGLPTLNESNVNGTSVAVPAIVEANYLIRAYSDKKTISSTIELTSAPLTIPFTIDKIYTMQVFAS
jgi:hypothetical protein